MLTCKKLELKAVFDTALLFHTNMTLKLNLTTTVGCQLWLSILLP